MTTFPLLISMTVLMLCGALTNGQDTNVRNFHIAQQTNTHITFSWDIVDGLDTSRYIESFTFYFRQRSNPSSSSSFVSPTYDATIKTNGGRTFSYTITLADHTLFGPYVMWIRVNRRTLPLYTYSEQISVVIGGATMEMSIRLWPSEPCYEFSSYSVSSGLRSAALVYEAVQSELYWVLVANCQCTYPDVENIVIANGYFTCGSSGYVTFRADIYSTDGSSDPASFKSILTNWLQGQNTEKTITIYGRRYSVEPGPCGVTVPSLYAPECSAASSAVAATTSDNTAVIVASVFAAMFFIIALGLIGYLIAVRRCQTNSFTGGRVAIPSTSSRAATICELPKACDTQGCELEPRDSDNNHMLMMDN